jgi:capsular polysaccharide biosynthesis protein
VQTYVEIARSENVARNTATSLGLASRAGYTGLPPAELVEKLRRTVTVTNVLKSNILSIKARSQDPKLAADLSNAWAASFIAVNLDLSKKGAESKRLFLEDQARQIRERLNNPRLRLNEESKADEVMYAQLLEKLQEAKLAESVDDTGIVVVDPATVPLRPIAPKKTRSVLLGLLLGLFLGVQAAFLLDRARDRVKHEDTLKRVTGLPNYAVVPDFREDYPQGLGAPDPKERFTIKALVSNPVFAHSFYKESFKVLRTNLTLAQADKPLKAMAVLSPGPEEGKTLVNANLAIALAETGKKTLLVDCPRTPRNCWGAPPCESSWRK